MSGRQLTTACFVTLVATITAVAVVQSVAQSRRNGAAFVQVSGSYGEFVRAMDGTKPPSPPARESAGSTVSREEELKPDVVGRTGSRIEERSVRSRVDDLEARYEIVRRHPVPPCVDPRRRETAVRELTEQAAELLLRGAADAYRVEATAQIEYESLKRITERLRLPNDLLPTNRYALLDPAALDRHEASWARCRDILKERAAVAPGLYDLAIAQVDDTLDTIRRGKREAVDRPMIRWHAAVSNARPTAEFVAWVQQEAVGKSAAIDAREAQLLQEALARNRLDYPAQLRAVERALGWVDPKSAEADVLHRTGRNALAMIRAVGLSPPATACNPLEFFANRFRDPLAALQAEADLRMRHPRGDAVPMEEFITWVADNLTDVQLFEVLAYADAALDLLARFELGAPSEFLPTVRVDRQQAQLEASVLKRVADRRRQLTTSPNGRQPTWKPVQGYEEVDRSSPKYRKVCWHVLEAYVARTHPTEACRAWREELELSDLADRIEVLDKSLGIYTTAYTLARKYPNPAKTTPNVIRTADQSIFESNETTHTPLFDEQSRRQYERSPGVVAQLPNGWLLEDGIFRRKTGIMSTDSPQPTYNPATGVPTLDLAGRALAEQFSAIGKRLDRASTTAANAANVRRLQDRVRAGLISLPPPSANVAEVIPYVSAIEPPAVSYVRRISCEVIAAVERSPERQEEQKKEKVRQEWLERERRAATNNRLMQEYRSKGIVPDRSTTKPRPKPFR